jgi:hypothetical protein
MESGRAGRTFNPWLVAVAALAAAVVAVGGWILPDGEPSPPQGLASDEVSAMLAARIAAFDRGGAEGRRSTRQPRSSKSAMSNPPSSPEEVRRSATALRASTNSGRWPG